jgi:hypothetical protein
MRTLRGTQAALKLKTGYSFGGRDDFFRMCAASSMAARGNLKLIVETGSGRVRVTSLAGKRDSKD